MNPCAERLAACRLLAALAALLFVAGCGTAQHKTSAPDAPPSGKRAASAANATPAVNEAEADEKFKKALALMQQKKYADAKQQFADIAKTYPTLSGALTNLGILEVQSKKKDEALREFARAVEANPDNAVAYNWLGILYRESGEYTKAEGAYLKAISLRSGYANAHYNLGLLYDGYLHRPKDALTQYHEYEKLSSAQDLKLKVWIKALEAQTQAASPAAAPGTAKSTGASS